MHIREQILPVVDNIWCISPKVKTHIIKTVASMYTSAAGKQVARNSASHNDNRWCIFGNMNYGHALRERKVDGIWCISPKVKPQIIKSEASMYTSAAY